MRFLIKWVIASIIGWYALSAAIHYGGIWQSQARPTHGVEVVFLDGHKARGALQRAWSGEWVLSSEQGGDLHFTDHLMMTFEPVREPVAHQWFDWRGVGPAALVILAYLAWLLQMLGGAEKITRK